MGKHPIRFGIQTGQQNVEWKDLESLWKQCDDWGYDSLWNFEEYSSQCSVENWNDAATHACVYAYTNQARWLMEKALRAVLETHQPQK